MLKIGLIGGVSWESTAVYYKLINEAKGKYDLDVITPEEEKRKAMDDIIYHELCLGLVKEDSRQAVKSMIHSLISKGAEGIILACTELGLIFGGKTIDIPVLDTTEYHAKTAVALSLSGLQIDSH